MATEVGRMSFGMTDKGQVVVIEMEHYAGKRSSVKESSYLVKHGVRTVGEYTSTRQAYGVAKAISGNDMPVPEPELPVVVEEPAPEPVAAAPKRSRK